MASADLTRKERKSFRAWLVANGAELLEPFQYEDFRFRAHGILCIVYERNRKGRRSFVPELAQEAFRAWDDKQTMDLSNPDPDPPVEDWHATGAALLALGDRAKAGAVLDIPHEAAALGIPAARLIRSLTAQGAPIPESPTP